MEDTTSRQLKSKQLEFILSSNGKNFTYFTLVSAKTSKRITYRVKFAPAKGVWSESWFVEYLFGQNNEDDYAPLGQIKYCFGELTFRTTKAAKERGITAETPAWAALNFTLSQLAANKELTGKVEVWHSGRCGRCAKRLTVPESIAQGYGPECIGKL
jgi:hypothetical protein